MGRSESSNPEPTEMPEDSERASEQDKPSIPVSSLVTDGAGPSSPTVASSSEPSNANANQANASEPTAVEPANDVKPKRARKPRARSRSGIEPNNVRKLRQEAMMSKAELARRAGVSPLTIDRVEAGCPCRMDTKRKILEALGLKPSARTEVWPDIDAQS